MPTKRKTAKPPDAKLPPIKMLLDPKHWDACAEGYAFAVSCKSWRKIWATCARTDWMSWLISKLALEMPADDLTPDQMRKAIPFSKIDAALRMLSSHAAGYRSSSHAAGYLSSSHAAGYLSSSHAAGYRSSSHAAGYRSSSHAAGYRSEAKADGWASAGKDGIVIVGWHDGKRKRYAIGYVGENGIEQDIYYRAESRKLIAVGPVAEIDKREKRDVCPKCQVRRDVAEGWGHYFVSGEPCTGVFP